jgi:D-threo-aldose 1-dehydrogenase
LMEDSVSQGKVGSFGVASERVHAEAVLRERPAYCRVLQYEWSVKDAPDVEGVPFRIHHRALTDNFRELHGRLVGDGALAERWSAEVGADLRDREMLAALMMKASLELHPASLALVSSKNAAHLQANVRTAEDARLRGPALKLHELMQAVVGASNGDSMMEVAR